MQNSLARIVCKTSKFCHITPVLHSLHWLKIKYRIFFKINTLVYKTLHTNSLSTLENYCHRQKNKEPVPQKLDSLFDLALLKPRLVLMLFRAVVAPYLWNSLPAEVRTAETYSIFRKKFKTHFFASCYPS